MVGRLYTTSSCIFLLKTAPGAWRDPFSTEPRLFAQSTRTRFPLVLVDANEASCCILTFAITDASLALADAVVAHGQWPDFSYLVPERTQTNITSTRKLWL